ncbi:hypothetical protein ACMAZF_00050 [Psychrobium sp. nBUS_13]|uniref:hypothetical protein n=1 Tax=Psychrobium sp. nBUS_13 TaxID=3395319 RepID=UPI003EB806CA
MTFSLKPLIIALSMAALSQPSQAGEENKESNKKWDVNAPKGDFKDISIKVSEGTWMNVDVSPDGKTIVFDLLGDIYSMPIAGGTATPLIKGIAWHMQPTYTNCIK